MPFGSRSKKVLTFSSFWIRSIFSKVSFVVVPFGLLPPAPFRRMSQVPSFSLISLRASSIDSISKTLQPTAIASPPASFISSAQACAASLFKSRTATLQPCSASVFANEAQSIPPPPVTTATLPFKFSCLNIITFPFCSFLLLPTSRLDS